MQEFSVKQTKDGNGDFISFSGNKQDKNWNYNQNSIFNFLTRKLKIEYCHQNSIFWPKISPKIDWTKHACMLNEPIFSV